MDVTKLLPLDTTYGFLASDNIFRLARIFVALSSCGNDLTRYYDDIVQKKVPKLSCLVPNPTPVVPSDALPDLTYTEFLSRTGHFTSVLMDIGNTTTAMYIATLSGTNKEVVKFTERYNEVAHRILDSPQSYIFVGASSAAYTWKGNTFRSSKQIRHKSLPSSTSVKRRISTHKIMSLGT